MLLSLSRNHLTFSLLMTLSLNLNLRLNHQPAPLPTASHVNPELCQVAYEFGKYLASLPNKTATASQACKQVYLSYPSAREILTRHGKLRGLIKACPYLQMDGEAHGGLYLLSLNQEAFRKLFPSL